LRVIQAGAPPWSASRRSARQIGRFCAG
jgi:hypothetical protein